MAFAETCVCKADETAKDELDVERIGQQNQQGLVETEQSTYNDEGKNGEDGSFDDTNHTKKKVKGEEVVEEHFKDQGPTDEEEGGWDGEAQRGKQKVGVYKPCTG